MTTSPHRPMMRLGAALTAAVALAGLGSVPRSWADATAGIASGAYLLSTPTAGTGGYGVAVTSSDSPAAAFGQSQPCQVMVKNGTVETDLAAGYTSVSTAGDVLTGSCDVRTAGGSTFRFVDRYLPQDSGGAFRLERTVTVVAATAADQGFGSRFVFGPQQARTMDDYHFFSPAVWYDHNDYAGQGAIASDYQDQYFYYRETRAALPFTMMQDADSGVTLSLAHLGPAPSSSGSADEDGADWQVDSSLRYASIGAQRIPQPMLAVVYPGTEGNKVYGAPAGTTWRRRGNPVQVGFQQSYDVVIRAGQSTGFAAATQEQWRYFFELFDSPVDPVSPDAVYRAGIGLLKTYLRQGTGRGVPFRVALPDGVPVASDWNYVMGYVGAQVPMGYELLRYGVENGDAEATSDGMNVLNFWTRQSLTPVGLPATWFDEAAGGGFRDDPRYWSTPIPIYLRYVSDALEELVDAAKFMREHATPQPMWENFCTAYGNWLLRNQNPDGSFARAFGYDGVPVQTTAFSTTDPIRFLTRLYLFTGDARYLDAAQRAGTWARANISQPFHYVGGTADGPTVLIDKEAGVEAMHAYLSLYDATKEPQWLSAATDAAGYAETWMYAWNFPVAPGSGAAWQQKAAGLGTTGLSFIATSLSAVDTFLSYGTVDYYRLYLFTGDQHLLRVSRLLANNTKRGTELSGNLGYTLPGLAEEATSVADFTHAFTDGANRISYWLPWLTVSQIEPYADLRDMFGSMSIDDIETLPLSQRQQINDSYPVRGPRYGGGTTDVANPGFELPGSRTTGGIVPAWRTWTPDAGKSSDAAYTDGSGASHSGQWHLTLSKATPFALSAYQDLPVGDGTYRVTAWVESTGGFRATQLELHNYASPDVFSRAQLPVTTTGYKQVSLTVTVTTGTLTIGFWADDPTGKHWDRIDDVQVTRLS